MAQTEQDDTGRRLSRDVRVCREDGAAAAEEMLKPQERPAEQLDAAEAGLLGGASPGHGGRRGRVVETKLHREQSRGRSVRTRDPTESGRLCTES